MQGLKSWNTSAVPMATYSVNAFRAFLPYPVLKPPLGQPWYIVESRIEKNGMYVKSYKIRENYRVSF